jgi:hypothetical protein
MTKKKRPHIDEGGQAAAILRHLSQYLTGAPYRKVTITFGADGWHVALDETRRTSGGSMTDALAQAAQVATFEEAAP